MTLLDAPVARITLLARDWKKIDLIRSHADEIGQFIYPTAKKRVDKPLAFRSRATQWARHNFAAVMESAVVLVDTEEENEITVYLLMESAGVLIQAMDAVVQHPVLQKRIYRRVHNFSVADLCDFITEAGDEEDEPAVINTLAVDGDLINRFNQLLTTAPEIIDLKSLIK